MHSINVASAAPSTQAISPLFASRNRGGSSGILEILNHGMIRQLGQNFRARLYTVASRHSPNLHYLNSEEVKEPIAVVTMIISKV
jgi:hypothetical protein